MKIPLGVLNTPRKRQHMAELRKRMRTLRMAIQRKEATIQALFNDAPVLNEDLSDDFVGIMSEMEEDIQKHPNSSFKHLFWEQQVCTYKGLLN